jgi:hypothetical protein
MQSDSRRERFYFHIMTDSGFFEDEEGVEFPSSDSARTAAVQMVRELVAEAIKHGKELNFEVVVVADQRGNEITRVAAMQVLPMRLKSN